MGCSRADEPAAEPVDSSAVADTALPEDGGADAVDTAVTDAVEDRRWSDDFTAPIGVVHAAPGGSLWACIGLFKAFAPPADQTTPVYALGPFGNIDPDAVTDRTRDRALAYGDGVVSPLTTTTSDLFNSPLTAVAWLVPGEPRVAWEACGATWESVRSNPKRWKTFPPKSVHYGQGVAIIATDDQVVLAQLPSRPTEAVVDKPLIAIRVVDVSNMMPSSRAISLGGEVLATASTFGSVSEKIVPSSIAMGDPMLKIESWSSALSMVSTFTNSAELMAGHSRTMVWFGAPDTGIHAIWFGDW
jgi:hypothetical protein